MKINLSHKRLHDIISECVEKVLINEIHGVSNDYLGDLVDFILKNLYKEKKYNFNEISHLFNKFPTNLKRLFKGCSLQIVASENLINGRCQYDKISKTISVSVSPRTISQGERTKRDMEKTLYHELTHMIDLVASNDNVGDNQTKVLSTYNDKIVNRISHYREFNDLMYGFTNLEMRGRLAAFKEHVRDLIEELKSDTEFNNAIFIRGYNGGYKYFMREIKYSYAYKYAIGKYLESYNSFIKNCKYESFGYKGVIEMANNISSLIGLKTKLNQDNPTLEEFETAHKLLTDYFDSIISKFKRKMATIALDCWYEFVESLKDALENSQEGKKIFKNFMNGKTLY